MLREFTIWLFLVLKHVRCADQQAVFLFTFQVTKVFLSTMGILCQVTVFLLTTVIPPNYGSVSSTNLCIYSTNCDVCAKWLQYFCQLITAAFFQLTAVFPAAVCSFSVQTYCSISPSLLYNFCQLTAVFLSSNCISVS